MRKKGRLTGFMHGLFFSANMTAVSSLVMLQKVKDSGEWKDDGFDTWKEFVEAATGSSYETINRRLSELKKLGAEVVGIIVSLGLGIKDVKMIEYALIEDIKTGKKVLKIDEKRTIPFDEDRKDEIQTAIDLLREQRESEKKETKRLTAKVDGIDKEHKKELKAMQTEIESLHALIPKDEHDREWAEKYIAYVNSIMNKLDMAIRAFAFHKKVFADPVLQAKVIGIFEEGRKRFADFEQDFDGYITEEGE